MGSGTQLFQRGAQTCRDRCAFVGVDLRTCRRCRLERNRDDLGDRRPQSRPRRRRDGDSRAAIRNIIERETAKTNLPADIAEAVVFVESGYNASTIGSVGEIGLMQVRPETAAMLGFRGNNAELAEPEVNIHYGVLYLSRAWHLAGGDLCRALMKYRAGPWRGVHDPAFASLLQPSPQSPCRHELLSSGPPGCDHPGHGADANTGRSEAADTISAQ
ncbi:lytic transglycosylase domain-containing protein [Bradyrhizobium sp. LLZ17]|uniref:lytic transglycosylase domain-containing protein n=1 Tax=Bradyrhizobium sp. LLZ17 TaxID=3239388 RepID=UPI00350F3C30